MNQQPVYTADEFQAESRYIDTLIWEAIAVEPDTSVLFCGYGPDADFARRAIETGARVTVIEHRDDVIRKFGTLDAKLLRGSTSVIPSKENAFDLAISYYYLHEIDPFFHAQVLSELARVARRVAVIEPAPPGDMLGKRIASLYSQAKRELGQFEYYQQLEYWKKLLQSVKADVSQHVFAFAKVPPREYLVDTVELLLDTIEAEAAPREFMDELRQIARRSDAQLLPPPRYVLVGAAVGELPKPRFTARVAPPVRVRPVPAIAAPTPPATPGPAIRREAGYEFPPVQPPAHASPRVVEPAEPVEPPPAFTPGLPFGAPAPPQPPQSGPVPNPALPFGVPFAIGENDTNVGFGLPPDGGSETAWAWEPPDGEAPK
ncbi:MAG: class I SAM-dependent methyltransferase [Candidatus Eremiobacteraeota bacterium]|nr:class I SAM-dependent methyltransferase [Candidatus Eremiobacteraeota bacterium]